MIVLGVPVAEVGHRFACRFPEANADADGILRGGQRCVELDMPLELATEVEEHTGGPTIARRQRAGGNGRGEERLGGLRLEERLGAPHPLRTLPDDPSRHDVVVHDRAALAPSGRVWIVHESLLTESPRHDADGNHHRAPRRIAIAHDSSFMSRYEPAGLPIPGPISRSRPAPRGCQSTFIHHGAATNHRIVETSMIPFTVSSGITPQRNATGGRIVPARAASPTTLAGVWEGDFSEVVTALGSRNQAAAAARPLANFEKRM